MDKKVLIITYYWPPAGGPGVQRCLKFVKYLPQFGVEPIVLTVDPEKATYPLRDESLFNDIPLGTKVFYASTFEPFEYYKKVTKNEVPFSGFANEGNPGLKEKIIRFIRGNFFIPDARKGWNKYACKTALLLIQKYRIQTIITTSPPHSTQLIGIKLKSKCKLFWIADLRDPWSEIYYNKKLFMTKPAKIINKNYEKKVLKIADHIITVSQSVMGGFLKTCSDVLAKSSIIPNGYDSDDFKGIDVKPDAGSYLITYTGTISDQYPIINFFVAVAKIKAQSLKKIKIKFVGKVDPSVVMKIKQYNLDNLTEFIQYVNHKKAIEYLVNSDMLLLIIPDINENKGILTGKLFEYLAAKKPILCIGPIEGDAAKLIELCKAGKTFSYSETDTITSFLKSQMENGLSNWQFKTPEIEKYSRQALTNKLVKIIPEV